ncbi:hypothetical protein AX17_007206 [Amanita inopinata Kibby_2008]|nr:hypothetical protein AX17_007206 [Amanita inopinata Kibby_2008]
MSGAGETTLVTKRLHISGLTPALSASDISQRLSSFGTVKAMDGFGALDGVGKPRKFGYVTMEATPVKLAKCLTLLSGTTWKGAKLRIGEAKPDFSKRIAAENAADEQEGPAKKKRRIDKYGSVHAQDMSLVTKENAHSRPGWVVTPLGRVLRPMKMRPLKPLTGVDSATATATATVVKGRENLAEKKSKKRREKKVEVRARRKKIDMLKYGSVHLKGVFVDVAMPDNIIGDGGRRGLMTEEQVREGDMESDDDEGGGDEVSGDESMHVESESEHGEEREEERLSERSHSPGNVGERNTSDSASQKAKTMTNADKLKDLFAPREEEATFSLLGRLDLDLELDDDVPFPISSTEETEQAPITESIPVTVPTFIAATGQIRTHTAPTVQLNPKQALFFPLPASSILGSTNKGRARDFFDIAKEKGWNWRDSSVGFYRTETEDEIRKRWEESRGELTKEWKRRWKEAGKMSRRRYGGVGADTE